MGNKDLPSRNIIFVELSFIFNASRTLAVALGILIQTSSAFREVQSSFSLFIQNWTRITELRSIYRRLTEFEKAIGYKDPDKPLPVVGRS